MGQMISPMIQQTRKKFKPTSRLGSIFLTDNAECLAPSSSFLGGITNSHGLGGSASAGK